MYDIYFAIDGDTIESIANKFNTSPEVIKQLNGYMGDIFVGNSIIVPKIKSDYFDYYKVTKGDTLFMGNGKCIIIWQN